MAGTGSVPGMSLTPIRELIAERMKELTDLRKYPEHHLAEIIAEIGFTCTYCARCCTRAFNDHVFLLDTDVSRVLMINPSALEPAPYYEFCDRNGTFYVAGYALTAQDDRAGSCVFLLGDRCRIYSDRPAICRVYPYMLHREADDSGTVDWRQFAGLDQHGEYHGHLTEDECIQAARETIAYEEAFLMQEIAFFVYMERYFKENGLKHVQKKYDETLRRYHAGGEVLVMVWHAGSLDPVRVRRPPAGKAP